MARKNIDQVLAEITKIKESLSNIIEDAKKVVTDVKEYHGEIDRVVSEQFVKYFIPAITKLQGDYNTPGSIDGVLRFLSTCPISFLTTEPTVEDLQNELPQSDVSPNLDIPVGTNEEINSLPLNASYNTMEPQAAEPEVEPQMESVKMKEDYPIYQVVRKTNKASALSAELSNIEDVVIGDYKTLEDAKQAKEDLDASILPSERDLFNVEYEIVKKDRCECDGTPEDSEPEVVSEEED